MSPSTRLKRPAGSAFVRGRGISEAALIPGPRSGFRMVPAGGDDAWRLRLRPRIPRRALPAQGMIPRIAPVGTQLVLCFIAEKVFGLAKSYDRHHPIPAVRARREPTQVPARQCRRGRRADPRRRTLGRVCRQGERPRDGRTDAARAAWPADVLLRINALDTGLALAGNAAVMPDRPGTILLPKCTGPADAVRLAHCRDALEATGDIEPGVTRILAIVTNTADTLFRRGASRRHQPLRPPLFRLVLPGTRPVPDRRARRRVWFPSVYVTMGDLDDLSEKSAAARRNGFEPRRVIIPRVSMP